MSVPAQRPSMARNVTHSREPIAVIWRARWPRRPWRGCYRRLAAMLAVAEGQPLVAVAHQARVDRTTVRRWIDRYLVGHDPNALVRRHLKWLCADLGDDDEL